MPDIKQNTYSRQDAINDTGYSNLGVQGAPMSQIPEIVEASSNPLPKNPFDALDNISNNLDKITRRDNPYLSTNSTPYKTPLSQTIRYDDPTYGFNPFNPNLEYQYGDRQGAIEKWRNNLAKFAVNTAGAFIESLATIPLVINAIASGDMSKFYDNPISNTVNGWMENLEQTLPNYETTFGANHPVLNWIPFIGNSGDSWGGLLKNMGFTVGSVTGAIVQDLGVGALTGGIGEAPLLPMQMMKAFSKIGRFFGTADEAATTMAQALRRGEALSDIVNQVASTNRNINRFRYGLSTITSALSEGTFEANNLFHS